MKQEINKTEEIKVKPTSTTTQIFVFFQESAQDGGGKGLVKFNTKPELDDWLKITNVTVVNIIRGREKKFGTKVVFQ